jgi:hypothetical protein
LPLSGFGTVRGIGNFFYNLRGDGGNSTAAGNWGSQVTDPTFFITDAYGTPRLNGALLEDFAGAQFVPPGFTANSTNPVPNMFRAVWKPADYTTRTVNFRAEPGTHSVPGQYCSLYVAYGVTRPDPNDPTTWYDNLLIKYISSDFGSGISIPIAPAPSTACVLAGLTLASVHRSRGAAKGSKPPNPAAATRVEPPV